MGSYVILIKKIILHSLKIVILWSLVYLIAASIIAGSFPWYYLPLMPGFAVIVLVGVEFVSDGAIDRAQVAKSVVRKLLKDSMGISFVAVLFVIQISFWYVDWQLYQGGILDNRYNEYLQVAEWLEQNSSEEDTLAAFEIGYLGYFTNMNMIDLFGLISPELIDYMDEGSLETLRIVLSDYSPNYVLLPGDENLMALISHDDRYEVDKVFNQGNLTLYQLEK